MSAAFVIDASVGLAWVHPDQATEETDNLLSEVENGAEIIVPMLWFAEVANTLLVLQRRKRLTAEDRRAALETLSKFTYTVDEDGSRRIFAETSDFAERFNLSVYDGIYLELAHRRKVPLCSRDAALLAAAKKLGLKTL